MEQQLKRLERLTSILIQLQSKRIIKAQEIADRFEISLRTVYRDIRALELAGVPIASEAGYGYSLTNGFNLPPVMFTEEEANALIMSHKIVEQFSDESIRKNHQSALTKIQAILNNKEKDQIEILNKRTKVYVKNGLPKNDTSYLAIIQKSISEKKKLKLSYLSHYKNETTNRIVSPIGIMYYSSGWHLIGWCDLRKDYRDFNTQRIKNAILSSERFYPSKLISLDYYFERLNTSEKVWEISIRIKKETYPLMATQKYCIGFVSDKEMDNYYEAKFISSDLNYFGRTMLIFGNAVTIKGPIELIEKMKFLVNELKEHY